MHDSPLSRKTVLLPQAFDMDQGTLALTEQIMLQSRKWQEIVVSVHVGLSHSCPMP